LPDARPDATVDSRDMTSIVETRPTATVSSPKPVRRRDERDVPAIATHLTLAIVCALVFFRPLGTAAVVSAGHVLTLLALGDTAGARRASRRTLWLCGASAAVTLLFLLVIVLGARSYSQLH
jgi:ABC-type Fe3+ transport system permease subunit